MSENYKKIEEQEKVLEVSNKNAIISASAGSGKTSVLTRKISKYIQEYIDISNILALTYTNAAAGEMKERLSASLFSYIEELGVDDEKIEKFAEQIDKMSTADVSTFHSFYERVIKKYFYILGVDPSFKILETEDSLVLKEESFEYAINELKEFNFESYLKITDILGKKRKDNSIRDRIFKLDEFLSSQLNKEDWLTNIAKKMFLDKEKTYSILRDDIMQTAENSLMSLNDLLKKAVEFGEDKLSSHLNDCCLKLEELKKLDFKQLYEEINNKFSFSQLRMSKDIQNLELFENIKTVKENFKDSIKPYKRSENDFGDWETIESSFDSCSKNIQTIIDLYLNYNKILKEKKKEANSYDFSDLEEFCYELLKNEKVREMVKNQYKLIFIDEFQDTNSIQYEIVKKISNKNNAFIVGDPKQSIYGFRQTDVDIFNNVYEEFLKIENAEALSLKSNFRSNKKILNFVNNVFDVLMNKEISGVDYKKDARFEPKSENDCDNNSVIISLIKKEKEEKVEEEKTEIYEIFKDLPKEEDVSLEAKLIAHQISLVLKENIYDDKLKVERKVEYKDIAILLKNRSNLLTDLIKTFQKYNIPFLVNDNVDLLLSKDVNLLFSILKLCNNINDDISLAPVLASNFVGLSYNDLAKIRMSFPEEKYYYNCCAKYLEQNDEISSKLNDFYHFINEIKFNIEFKGIAFALNFAISKHHFFEKIMLKEDGKIRAEIVKQFISYIEQSKFNYDLLDLIKFIDNSKEICVSSIKKCDSESIEITTIHGSKGLEYPIVFVADTGRDLNKTRPEMSDLKINKKYGIAIKNYDETERKIYPSIFERVIKIEEKRRDLAENLRLLYVALTRAKNKLFISGLIDKDILPIATDYDLLNSKQNTYINYILGSLDKENIDKVNGGVDILQDDVFIYTVRDKDFKQDYVNKDINIEDKIKKIKRYLKNEYIYSLENSTLAQKTSVTKIISESNGQENLTTEPKNFRVSENLNGETTADKGTIIHSILEKIDFRLEGLALEKELISLIEKYGEGQFKEEYLLDLIKRDIFAIKKLIPNDSKIYKEKQFLLNASLKDIFGEDNAEKILIQGKLDLICLGDKNIIIDYKYTSIKDEEILIDKYKKQLVAYKFAVEKALPIKIDEVYIFNLTNGQAIIIK